MSKNKYIYLLGGFFLIISIVKYIFVPVILPPIYFTFEMLGLATVLSLVFYVSRMYLLKTLCNSDELAAENKKLIKENVRLIDRIDELESDENELRDFNSDKERLLAAMESVIADTTDQKDLSLELFSLLKDQFELVAGVVYTQSSEKDNYKVIHRYALDEEWTIEDVEKGEGIHGQAIQEGHATEVTDIPEDYFEAASGIGSAQPGFIYLLPLNTNNILIEVASFKGLGLHHMWNEFLESNNKTN